MGFSRRLVKTTSLLRMTYYLIPSPLCGRGLSFFSPRPFVGDDNPFVSLAPLWERVRVRGYLHSHLVAVIDMTNYPTLEIRWIVNSFSCHPERRLLRREDLIPCCHPEPSLFEAIRISSLAVILSLRFLKAWGSHPTTKLSSWGVYFATWGSRLYLHFPTPPFG